MFNLYIGLNDYQKVSIFSQKLPQYDANSLALYFIESNFMMHKYQINPKFPVIKLAQSKLEKSQESLKEQPGETFDKENLIKLQVKVLNEQERFDEAF